MLQPFIRAACLCAATALSAQSLGLSGEEIRDLVAGATIEIDTPLGTKLPIRYTLAGRLSGEARDLASYLGAPTDTGRWWITADRLCHKWNQWFDSQPQCLRLRKVGRIIHWSNADGTRGTAAIAVPAPVQAHAVLAHAQGKTGTETAMSLAPPDPAPPRAAPAQAAAPAAEPRSPAQAQPGMQPASAAPTGAPSATGSLERPSQQPTAVPARPDGPIYTVANVERDDVLNVRSGPSAEFDVIGELKPGTREISITGACRSQWCPVQHKSTRGWVNRRYLANDEAASVMSVAVRSSPGKVLPTHREWHDIPDAPRTCLTPPARALLERIEEKFGPVRLVSTCRPGAIVVGTGRPSRHESGNAFDFTAGARKVDVVEWLIANHRDGGTMTYADLDHIHVDIGPHFVSIGGGPWTSWPANARDFPPRLRRTDQR